MSNIQKYLARIDGLINLATETLHTANRNTNDYPIWVSTELFVRFKTSGLECLKDLFGVESSFYKEFKLLVVSETDESTLAGRGILTASKNNIEDGWFYSIKSIVSAEIFTDFLETAKYLLDEEFKDAAAVMLGGILEEHLRQLAKKNEIDIKYKNDKGELVPKKADRINSDLTKASVYSSTDHKQIINWLGLRNAAAHGEYDKYQKSQIKLFYDGLVDFFERVPA